MKIPRKVAPVADSPALLARDEAVFAVGRFFATEARLKDAYARSEADGDKGLDRADQWQKWTDLASYVRDDAREHLFRVVQTFRADIETPHHLDRSNAKLRPCAMILDGVMIVSVPGDDQPTDTTLVIVPMADVVNLDDPAAFNLR